MQKISILLLFVLQLQSVQASIKVTDIAVSYNSGAKNKNINCSGAFVKYNTKRYFISASHCFKKPPSKKVDSYIYNSRNYKKVRSSKVTVNFSEDHYYNPEGDTLFKEISKSTSIKTNELFLSSVQPAIGDKVTVLGYPIIRSKRVATKLSCNFLGSTIYETPVNPKGIGRIIKCNSKLKSVIGISGGPVLNESGEYIGVMSAQILPAKGYKFQDKRFIYLIYNELTGQLLEKNQMQRPVEKFIKMIPGKYAFKEADESLYLSPSMYEIKK
ncbi:trypsin-like serine protease [Halobacteriovorax sp.]|uniref:trypsin-like serine protease n=1 Tax=Halobacteriovorax sp. TaxID=2020862 RepID=UPI003561A27A